jgi:hypothetical protein
MPFVEQHDAKINSIKDLKNKRVNWKLLDNKKVQPSKERPLDYPILFGVELEYEVDTPPEHQISKEISHIYRAQVVNRIEDTFKAFAFAKHDGSMKNGFEVVSVPMSRDAHLEQWKPFLAIAEENGLMVRRTCGMHVHVSRELLTPLQIGKIMAFIHTKGHHNFIKTMAGRNKPVYTGVHGEYKELEEKKITDINKLQNRYSAFNINSKDTIEFRLFKSSFDYIRIMANIEFCDALVRFTWPSLVSLRDIKQNGLNLFLRFVHENRKKFRFLESFLLKEKLIPERKILAKYKKKEEPPVKKSKPKRARRIIATKPKPNPVFVDEMKYNYLDVNAIMEKYHKKMWEIKDDE